MSAPYDGDEFGDTDGLSGHSHRRAAYRLLTEHVTMALADLADEIAVQKEGSSIDEITAEDVLVVYTELYDIHVPALERAGIVEYDQDRDLVSLTGYGASVSVDASLSTDESADSSTEEPPLEEDTSDGNGDTVAVELSLETIDAVHEALTTDERFDAEMAYDEVIRAVLTEAYA